MAIIGPDAFDGDVECQYCKRNAVGVLSHVPTTIHPDRAVVVCEEHHNFIVEVCADISLLEFAWLYGDKPLD